jgi:hypothetical protein
VSRHPTGAEFNAAVRAGRLPDLVGKFGTAWLEPTLWAYDAAEHQWLATVAAIRAGVRAKVPTRTSDRPRLSRHFLRFRELVDGARALAPLARFVVDVTIARKRAA